MSRDLDYRIKEVRQTAREELEQERFRNAVEAEKDRLRKTKWWHKLFPFTIRIERKT